MMGSLERFLKGWQGKLKITAVRQICMDVGGRATPPQGWSMDRSVAENADDEHWES